MKKTVVISLLGTTLDQGKRNHRWSNWRPSVAICQQENLLVDRYHLLYQEKWESLSDRISKDIKSVSPETEVVPELISCDDPWDFEEVYGVLHDYARKYHFDTDKEDYLIHITTGTHVAQICLFLLTESRHLPGKLLQTSPSKRKGVNIAGTHTVIDLDLSRYDRLAARFLKDQKDDISLLKSGIETRNREFNRLIELIEKVAVRSAEPILLTGATGVGKSQLARRIYELKKAHHKITGPFVEVNCATLRGDAAMSTLFGHKKGAFTGAVQDRPGLLCAAHNGILFLDEIGELGSDEQAMLLRAIEDRHFLPVGSDMEEESNFQLICGTNHDLKSEIAKGTFREDLLARIDLWAFKLPDLRDRIEDIAPNLSYELERFADKTGTMVSFNKEAMEKFLAFATSPEAVWRANFRDLNGAVTRMSTFASSGRINTEIVEDEINRLQYNWRLDDNDSSRSAIIEVMGENGYEKLDLFDRVQLEEVIKVCQDSKSLSDAGRKLFSVSRIGKKIANDSDRLRKYLAKFNLSWKKVTHPISSK